MYCEKCGVQNEEGVKFCSSCGNPLEAAETATDETAPVETTEAVIGGNDNIKKIVKLAIIAVAVIAVIFAAFKIIGGIFGSDKINYEKWPVYYVTDDAEFSMLKAGGKEAIVIDDGDEYEYGTPNVAVSADGKTYCYTKLDDDGDKALYFRKVGDKTGDKEVLIDKNVNSFVMQEDGKFVLYLDGDNLYYHNFKDGYRIAKDVDGYRLTDNDKKVLYYEMESGEDYSYSYTYYVRGLKENDEAVKLVSKADSFISYAVDKDGETYTPDNEWYYEKNGDFYYVKAGKDAVKVLSDATFEGYIGTKLLVCQSDTVTFKAEEDEYGYSDFYYIDEDDDKDDIQISVNKIYLVEGSKAGKPVAENIMGVGNKLVTMFKEDISGKKFEDSEDLEKMLEFYILKENGSLVSCASIDMTEIYDAEVSEDYKYLYTIEEYDEEKGTGTLKRYDINSKEISKKSTKIAEDVASFDLLADCVIVESEDGDDAILGAYKGNKYTQLTEENYDIIKYFEDENIFFFLDDYEEGSGVLKKYDNGKVTELASDVYGENIDFRSEDMIYFLSNYDLEDRCGELNVCTGKKVKKIADDVKYILEIAE